MTIEHTADYRRVFRPREYLQTYYSDEVFTDDEETNAKQLIEVLRQPGKQWSRVLEIGCGPTIHHAIPLAEYAEEIHLSDYLPQNLREVQAWLDRAPDAHDWGHYFRGVLKLQGVSPDSTEVNRLAELLRSKVSHVRECDLFQELPLGEAVQFDLVTLFYTAECAAPNYEEWQRMMHRISGLVAPGGTLFQVSMLNCSYYLLGEQKIPATPVSEHDLRQQLGVVGFDPARTKVSPVEIAAWKEHGFGGIIIAVAEKPN